MGLPAAQPIWEPPVEERIARLEANVEYIQRDVSDIKIDLREMRREFKQDFLRMDEKFEKMFCGLDGKFDGLKDSLASAKLWALGLYIALAAAMLGSMATGFLWLAEKL